MTTRDQYESQRVRELLTRELSDDDVIVVRDVMGALVGTFELRRCGWIARPWDAVAHIVGDGILAVGIDWPEHYGWDKRTARYGAYEAQAVTPEGKRGEVVAAGSWHRAPSAEAWQS